MKGKKIRCTYDGIEVYYRVKNGNLRVTDDGEWLDYHDYWGVDHYRATSMEKDAIRQAWLTYKRRLEKEIKRIEDKILK